MAVAPHPGHEADPGADVTAALRILEAMELWDDDESWKCGQPDLTDLVNAEPDPLAGFFGHSPRAGGHDTIADVLLSLKHAVVHPNQSTGPMGGPEPSAPMFSMSSLDGGCYSSPWAGPPPQPQVPSAGLATPMNSMDAGRLNLCGICGKAYARPSTLKTHLRTHSGERPYRCLQCSKCFSQAANLTAHLRTHSGEKPFRCPVCERRFSQSSSVTTHLRTHSGERPYRCCFCRKAFSDSSTLTKHLRIHSGEKPYQCKLCLLRFSQSGNLNRHMRVHANSA
ncbi:zinc finger protein 771-like [Ornithodoros turicata]|uniref:zinc finger protein 771-like n=1 Tax=Ornithodoros turicata TaxID=34597 RepID=UPI0031387FC1